MVGGRFRGARRGYRLPGLRPYDGSMTGSALVRPRFGVFAALFAASLTSTLLVAARVLHTRRLTFAFLVYNLLLAWIPVGFALAAHAVSEWRSRLGVALTGSALAGWLVFFPNAPYLMTDLMHLRVQHNPLFWLDLVALQAFAWTGLALGFVSLDVVQRLVARRLGPVASWVFAAVVMALSAFGVYLGRFRRWNSWDVARDPVGLMADVSGMVLHPFAHAQVVAFSAGLGAFLLTAYVVVQSLTWTREETYRGPGRSMRTS
jgi:uncharacterized membrane protein